MGYNKALLELGGRPMIALVAERLRTVVDEVIIAADDTRLYTSFADLCVPDQFPGVGTLGGIQAGLKAASHDLALVVGCDMPFLDPAVLSDVAAGALRVSPGQALRLYHEMPLHELGRWADACCRQVHASRADAFRPFQ